MYAELFKQFENAKNLGGKAWQHAVNLDLIEQVNIKDCYLHCFICANGFGAGVSKSREL